MKLIFAFLFSLLALTLTANADTSSKATLEIKGQMNDLADLELITFETRHRTEMQDSTCSRELQVGENRVCENVLRYRTQWYTIPGRQECHYGPSRVECHMEGGAVECYMENGRRVCRQTEGRQVCRNVPGEYLCQWVAPRQESRVVSYYDTVCRMVPRYETQYYACKKPVDIAYNVDIRHLAHVDLIINDKSSSHSNGQINISLNEKNEIAFNSSEANHIYFINKKAFDVQMLPNDTQKVSAKYELLVYDSETLLSPLKQAPWQMNLTKNELTFFTGKVLNAEMLQLKMKVYSPGGLFKHGVDKTVVISFKDLLLEQKENSTFVRVNLDRFIGALEKKRKYSVYVELSLVTEQFFGTMVNNPFISTTQKSQIENIKF